MVDEKLSPRDFARFKRLNRAVDLGKMLQGYGYDVYPDEHREQQFRCDLHGPDNKPSARFYPETNSTYCWVCQKARGPVDYFMEIEGYMARQAIERLETIHGLPSLPWSDDVASQEEQVASWIQGKIDNPEGPSFKDNRTRVRKLLESATTERDLDMDTILKMWEVFDRIDHGMRNEEWTEAQGNTAVIQLRSNLMEAFKCSPD